MWSVVVDEPGEPDEELVVHNDNTLVVEHVVVVQMDMDTLEVDSIAGSCSVGQGPDLWALALGFPIFSSCH